MTEELWKAFLTATGEVGIDVSGTWRAPLGRYLDLLLLWNQRINLTAIRDPREAVVRHFADSLALLPDLPPAARSLLDVGSGGGFPGAVIALVRPDLAVTLVESIQKKAAFLSTLRRELPLPNVSVEGIRLEELAHREPHPTYDVVVSRAAIPLPGWFEVARPFLDPAGVVLAMEGQAEGELPAGVTRRPYSIDRTRRSILRST